MTRITGRQGTSWRWCIRRRSWTIPSGPTTEGECDDPGGISTVKVASLHDIGESMNIPGDSLPRNLKVIVDPGADSPG
jgi:hypothetical protein